MKDTFLGMLLFLIITAVVFIPLFIINYIEKNYELTRYLWIFNIIVVIISPVYYYIYSTKEKRKTKKIEKNIVIKNIDFKYYRDIIEEYSPAMLSFILDGTEFDKDLGASVIYLINKGYLELQQDNKIIKTNKDCSKLAKDLQLICNSDVNNLLAFRKSKKQNINEEQKAQIADKTIKKWMESIEKQAVEYGLVIERKEYKMTSILIILCMLEVFYTFNIRYFGLFFFSCLLVFILILLKFFAYDKNKWVKTQKGDELYTKIVGLKNYIKDYSTLPEKELKEIEIWEDYIIYAIIFNDDSKLNREAIEFYKKICGEN